VSPIISEIIWARQLSMKIRSNIIAAKSMFKGLNALQNLEKTAGVLQDTITKWERERFSDWHSEIMNILQDRDQRPKYEMTGQLMEFVYDQQKSGGLLKVNYSEKLVTLVKDARAVGEHGYKDQLHPDIVRIVEQAKKFYKEGVALKQVANFYNSMGTQVIQCQKPMIIQQAQRFEAAVNQPMASNQRGQDGQMTVTW